MKSLQENPEVRHRYATKAIAARVAMRATTSPRCFLFKRLAPSLETFAGYNVVRTCHVDSSFSLLERSGNEDIMAAFATVGQSTTRAVLAGVGLCTGAREQS